MLYNNKLYIGRRILVEKTGFQMQEDLLNIIDGTEIKINTKFSNSIFFFKEDNCLFELQTISVSGYTRLWCSLKHLWRLFETEYTTNKEYDKIQTLINNTMIKYFKVNATPLLDTSEAVDYIDIIQR